MAMDISSNFVRTPYSPSGLHAHGPHAHGPQAGGPRGPQFGGGDGFSPSSEAGGGGGLPPELMEMMKQMMESLMGDQSSQSGGAGDDTQSASGGPGDDQINQIGDNAGCGSCSQQSNAWHGEGSNGDRPVGEAEEAKGGNTVTQRGGWGNDDQTINAAGGNNTVTQRGGFGADTQVINLK